MRGRPARAAGRAAARPAWSCPRSNMGAMKRHSRPPDHALRAALYCRISEDRYEEAEGGERQEGICEKFAADRGYDVVARFIDNDRSAMHGQRPNYRTMLDAIRRGEIDVVV